MNDQRGLRRRGGEIVVKYDGASLMPVSPNPTPVADNDNQLKAKLLYLGLCLFLGHNHLIKLLKLMYQGDKESPFRFVLMCLSSLVLIKVGLVLAMLCYDFGRSMYKKFFPRRHV